MKDQDRSHIVDYINSHERAEQNIRESFSLELLGRGHRFAAPFYMRLLGSNRLIRAERHISRIPMRTTNPCNIWQKNMVSSGAVLFT